MSLVVGAVCGCRANGLFYFDRFTELIFIYSLRGRLTHDENEHGIPLARVGYRVICGSSFAKNHQSRMAFHSVLESLLSQAYSEIVALRMVRGIPGHPRSCKQIVAGLNRFLDRIDLPVEHITKSCVGRIGNCSNDEADMLAVLLRDVPVRQIPVGAKCCLYCVEQACFRTH